MSLTPKQRCVLLGLDATVAAMLDEPSLVIAYLDTAISNILAKQGADKAVETCQFILRVLRVHMVGPERDRPWTSTEDERNFSNYVTTREGGLTMKNLLAGVQALYSDDGMAQVNGALNNPDLLDFIRGIVERN